MTTRSPKVLDYFTQLVITYRRQLLWHFLMQVMVDAVQGIRVMWTGMGAQLARDVPFSAICWTILEPVSSPSSSSLSFCCQYVLKFNDSMFWQIDVGHSSQPTHVVPKSHSEFAVFTILDVCVLYKEYKYSINKI